MSMRMTPEHVTHKKLYLLHYAPQFVDLTSLAEGAGLSRQALYRYFDKDKEFKQKINDNLGLCYQPSKTIEMMSMEKFVEFAKKTGALQLSSMEVKHEIMAAKEGVKTKTKTISVELPVKQMGGVSKDPKVIILNIEAIAKLYKEGVPLADACEAINIPQLTFNNYLKEGHPTFSAAGKVIWEEAKADFHNGVNNTLIDLAKRALISQLTDKDYTETTKIGAIQKGPDGQDMMVIQGVKQVTRRREASWQAAKYILESIDPAFSDREKEKKAGETEAIKYMSEEDLNAAIAEAELRAQQVREESSND